MTRNFFQDYTRDGGVVHHSASLWHFKYAFLWQDLTYRNVFGYWLWIVWILTLREKVLCRRRMLLFLVSVHCLCSSAASILFILATFIEMTNKFYRWKLPGWWRKVRCTPARPFCLVVTAAATDFATATSISRSAQVVVNYYHSAAWPLTFYYYHYYHYYHI